MSPVERRAGLLAEIEHLASADHPGDPVACLARIRQRLDAYDAAAAPAACPPWCVEHYVATDGTRNHSSAPRAVTGESAADNSPATVSVWAELREPTAGAHAEPHVVGIMEKVERADAELSSYQLREFAAHIVAVAELVEATDRARRAGGGDAS